MAGVCVGVRMGEGERTGADEGRDRRKQEEGGDGSVLFSSAFVLLDNNSPPPDSKKQGIPSRPERGVTSFCGYDDY